MRVLVIGGTGFIGTFVLQHVVEAGHDVAVLHRGATPLSVRGVREIRGTRTDLPAMRGDLRRLAPDVTIDMVLSSGRQARDVVEVVAGRTGRLVVISSQDVYRATAILHRLEPGPPDPVPLTEDSPLRTRLNTYPPDAIAMLKQVFAWLDDEYDKIPVERAATADPRLPVTILRLPMVYGPGDRLHRTLPIVKRVDDGRPVILLDERLAGWRGTRGYVEDVAAAIAVAATSPQAVNRVYNVGESVSYSELEWIRDVAAAAGFQGRVEVLPADLAPAHLHPPGDSKQHWVTSTARIRQELGFGERVAHDVALSRTVAWQRAHPPARIDPAQYDYEAEDRAFAAIGSRTSLPPSSAFNQ